MDFMTERRVKLTYVHNFSLSVTLPKKSNIFILKKNNTKYGSFICVAFPKSRKLTVSFVMSVSAYLSVRIELLCSYSTDFHEI